MIFWTELPQHSNLGARMCMRSCKSKITCTHSIFEIGTWLPKIQMNQLKLSSVVLCARTMMWLWHMHGGEHGFTCYHQGFFFWQAFQLKYTVFAFCPYWNVAATARNWTTVLMLIITAILCAKTIVRRASVEGSKSALKMHSTQTAHILTSTENATAMAGIEPFSFRSAIKHHHHYSTADYPQAAQVNDLN